MSCEGYEHKQEVVLVRHLQDQLVPVGTTGTIAGINREAHTLDVVFRLFGRLNGLDAHAFTAETSPPEPNVAEA